MGVRDVTVGSHGAVSYGASWKAGRKDWHPCTANEHIDGPGVHPEWDTEAMKGIGSSKALTGRRRPVEATEAASGIDDGAATKSTGRSLRKDVWLGRRRRG